MSSTREESTPFQGPEHSWPSNPQHRLGWKRTLGLHSRGTHAHFEEPDDPVLSRSGSPFTSCSQNSLATSSRGSTATTATSVGSGGAVREQESRGCCVHEDDSSSEGSPSWTNSPKPPLDDFPVGGNHIDFPGRVTNSGHLNEVYESDEDSSDLEVDDEFEDPEWSGGQDEIEAAVLSSIPDLDFAATLIVKLHEDHMTSEGSKIDGWREGIRDCAINNTSETKVQGGPNSGSGSQNTGNSRKRRSGSDDSLDHGHSEDEDGDERDGDEPQPVQVHGGPRSNEKMPMLACPFYKHDPVRYTICPETRNHYRVCASPFKNIQRIKEHIFRKHFYVQCERCFEKFTGSDRARCLRERAAHLSEAEPCAKGDESLREGISDVQWEKLKGNNSKKGPKPSTVQKWWDIWDVLFPGAARPNHPWYEQSNTNTAVVRPLHGDQQRFVKVFHLAFENLLANGKIQFTAGREEEMQENLMEAVQSAWNLYYRLWGHAASSSSSGHTYTQPTEVQTPASNNTYLVDQQPVTKKRKGNAVFTNRSSQAARPSIAYTTMPDQNALAGLTTMSQAMFTAQSAQTFSDTQQIPRYTPRIPPNMSADLQAGIPFFDLDIDMNFAGGWPNEHFLVNESEDLTYVNMGVNDSNDLPRQ